MKAYCLVRQIVGFNDTMTSVVLRIFSSPEDAKAARGEIQDEYDALFGPQSNTQLVAAGRPLHIRLSDFLVELGVKTIRHSITVHEVHDALIVQPRAGLILPS